MIAFSKIDGLDVSPRSENSSTSRWSSPPSIMLRRIWSSHGDVPAAVSAARRSLTLAVTDDMWCSLSLSAGDALDGLARVLGDVLGREPEVLVQRFLRPGRAERPHADALAVGPDVAVPANDAGRLDRHPRADRTRQDRLLVVVVLLLE